MPRIKWTGEEEYRGVDEGRDLLLAPGAEADVSDEKAEQLLADRPDEVELVKGATAKK